MALATRINTRRAGDSSRAARRAKEASGRRVDEIGATRDIGKTYEAVDRAGDHAIEAKFQELYALVDSEDEKAAIARTYVTWMKAERQEDYAVQGSVSDAVRLLKENNDFWLGAHVPAGSDDAA